jgi:molybdopterin/thiamine biosynthesis adenylyltransferase/rhodanese-related sulfurtransferase
VVAFSKSELTRYSRHLILPEVGEEGQAKLKAAKVLVVGAGGLGSPVSMYLAAAGIGTIGLVDFDTVDLSNLQRQIIYGTGDVGKQKTVCAAGRLAEMNPDITVQAHTEKLCAARAERIISQYDIVIDGTDNFPTRFLINDACVLLGKPNVFGSIFRFEGHMSLFHPPHGPCYRCMFPKPLSPDVVPNCAEGGVLGVLAGTIGALQATEAIKWILNIGDSMCGRLLIYDALSMYFDVLKIERNPECPICGDKPTITKLHDEVMVCAAASSEMEPKAARELMSQRKDVVLLDVRTPQEHALCAIDGAVHIPLNELPERMSELDKNRETIVYCKSGMRSAKACTMLAEAQFAKVHNLSGGIVRWAQEIDPSMTVY